MALIVFIPRTAVIGREDLSASRTGVIGASAVRERRIDQKDLHDGGAGWFEPVRRNDLNRSVSRHDPAARSGPDAPPGL
ncbi:hypothetical protein [Methylobacterium sp. GC_Met_2]|uniref:hypothetical protein n=1 Tax=Methylobacterium sp. GC_Met_2 TaxID=2937376 RepID=UPI00226AFF9B|nr:hypothetical protein [Methylobacterium sp. GC_Met_2]